MMTTERVVPKQSRLRRYLLPALVLLCSAGAITLSAAAWLGNQYQDGYKDGTHEMLVAMNSLRRGVVSAETDDDDINYIEEVSVSGAKSGIMHVAPHQCWLAKQYKPGKTVYFTTDSTFNLIYVLTDDGMVRLC